MALVASDAAAISVAKLTGCGGNDEIACHDDIGRDNKLSRLSEVELEAGTYKIVADGFYERSVGAVSLVMEFSDP